MSHVSKLRVISGLIKIFDFFRMFVDILTTPANLGGEFLKFLQAFESHEIIRDFSKAIIRHTTIEKSEYILFQFSLLQFFVSKLIGIPVPKARAKVFVFPKCTCKSEIIKLPHSFFSVLILPNIMGFLF